MEREEENKKTDADIVMDELDFNELVALEKELKATKEKLNELSGLIFRLEQDQNTYYNHEKIITEKTNMKLNEISKRHKLDNEKKWRIDPNTRKIVYVE